MANKKKKTTEPTFPALREYFLQKPSVDAFHSICKTIQNIEKENEKEIAVLYASEHLNAWDDELRIFSNKVFHDCSAGRFVLPEKNDSLWILIRKHWVYDPALLKESGIEKLQESITHLVFFGGIKGVAGIARNKKYKVDLKEMASFKKLKHLSFLYMERSNIINYDAKPNCESISFQNVSFKGYETMILGKKESSLESLKIEDCSFLKTLSLSKDNRNIRSLQLNSKVLKNLEGLEYAENLQSLTMSVNPKQQALDFSTFAQLKSIGLEGFKGEDLTQLALPDCIQEISLPCASTLSSLKGIERFPSVRVLKLPQCKELQDIQALKSLRNLEELDVYSCEKIESIDVLKHNLSLAEINLANCSSLKSISVFLDLPLLLKKNNLDLHGCSSLIDLEGLQDFTNLEELNLRGCSNLRNLSALKGKTLKYFNLNNCHELQSLEGAPEIQMESFHLIHCDKLRNLRGLSSSHIKNLKISFCEQLQTLDELILPALEELIVHDSGFTSLQITSFPLLRNLSLEHNPSLLSVQLGESNSSLTQLHIRFAEVLEEITNLDKTENLEHLVLFCLPQLKTIQGIQSSKEYRILSVDFCPKLPKQFKQ